MQTVLFIIVSVLAAIFVQVSNMNKLNRKFIENNQYFHRGKYWAAERFSIIGTLVFIILFCIIFPDAVATYKISKLMQYLCYALAGGIGNIIGIYALGRSEKKLKKLIDNQTNTGDE